jgi:Uma2 family endonuclease
MLGELNKASEFRVGTTGWTASDLDDPQIEALWFDGHYEIFEGALVEMPPSYFAGGEGLANLLLILGTYTRGKKLGGGFANETDIVINEDRVVRSDAIWLSPADRVQQTKLAKQSGRTDPDRTRILVPPTLIIENISPGHERRDRVTKRAWYAEFGVPNYWILDVFEKSLECLFLRDGSYHEDVIARGNCVIRTRLFPELDINTEEIWSSMQ